MSIMSLLIIVVIAGAALYLLNLVPMDGTLKAIIRVIVIVFLVICAIKLLLPMAGIS